jgi:hypothetical protein
MLEERLLIDPIVSAVPLIRLTAETFQSILDAADERSLEIAGSKLAKKIYPLINELYDASEEPLSLKEFVIRVLAGYAHWFQVEGSSSPTHRGITFSHPHGLKWSIFVKSYILSANDAVSKDKITIEIADQFVRIDFSPL